MSVRTWEGGKEKTVAGSVDLTDYDTTKINKDSLTISGLSNFSVAIDNQVRIEHKEYYEYFIQVTANGGTRSTTQQTQVAIVYGFVGKGLYTHTPVSTWVEAGTYSVGGLIYSGNPDDKNLTIYLSATNATTGLRFYIHLIRLK